MSVHYKFKSALEYDTVTFDGLHISVKDLKNAIVQQKRIGKNTDFDLQVTNAQTKEVYEDELMLIPKNTSLLIARVPLAVQNKAKNWEGYGHDNIQTSRNDDGGPAAKAVDLSTLDAPESDKIMAMMSQSTQDYDPSNYMKIRGANQVGQVPPNYRCYKCHQAGHWIKDCPLSQGSEQVDIKKSTGIPRSFMVEVEGPQVQGAMMTPYGSYAVPALDHQTYTQKSQPAPAPLQVQKTDIPEDLVCSICSDLLTDAVMIPCCGNSFCDECIRSSLLESEDHECPDCHDRDISPGTLIPNRFLRNSVTNFKSTTGYVKRQVYKPAVQIAEKEREKEREAIEEEGESRDTEDEKKPKDEEESEVQPADAEAVAAAVDESTATSAEKTIISEADSTEPLKTPIPDANPKDAATDKPLLVDPIISELPPGVSPTREKTPETHPIVANSQTRPKSAKIKSDHTSPRKQLAQRCDNLNEERPGTPTVDEPESVTAPSPAPAASNVNVINNGEYRPPNAPYPTGPPPPVNSGGNLKIPPIHHMQGQPPPPTQLHQHQNQGQYAPPPQHSQHGSHYGHGQPPPQPHAGMMHGPPPNYRLPPPGQQGPPNYNMQGMYAPPRPMFDQSRPPMSQGPPMGGGPPQPNYPNYQNRPRARAEYPPRPINPRTPPGIIDDPLEAFNRMLREKDERERRAKASRKGRSYSRSSSRSFSRSPPPRRRSRSPRRRSRSRSKSFSISRSRSRSYSPNHRASSSYRDYSPRRRPASRYRSSPQRSPSRYRYKDAPDRPREFDRDARDTRDRDRVDRERDRVDRDRDRVDRDRDRVDRDRERERDRDRDRDRDRGDYAPPKRDLGGGGGGGGREYPQSRGPAQSDYNSYYDNYEREKSGPHLSNRNPNKWVPPGGGQHSGHGGRDGGYYPHQDHHHHQQQPPHPHHQQQQQQQHHQQMPPYHNQHQQGGGGGGHPPSSTHPPTNRYPPSRDYPPPNAANNYKHSGPLPPVQSDQSSSMMQQTSAPRRFDDVLPPGTDQPLPPGEEPMPRYDASRRYPPGGNERDMERDRGEFNNDNRQGRDPRERSFDREAEMHGSHDREKERHSRDRDHERADGRNISRERDRDRNLSKERDKDRNVSRERERDRPRMSSRDRDVKDGHKEKDTRDKDRRRYSRSLSRHSSPHKKKSKKDESSPSKKERDEKDKDRKKDKEKDREHSDDEKSKKSKDKKKKRDKKENEKKKKKDKKEKKEKKEEKERDKDKHNTKVDKEKENEKNIQNKENQTKPSTVPEVSSEVLPQVQQDETPFESEKFIVLSEDPPTGNQDVEPEKPELIKSDDLYDDVLTEGIDNSIVESYGRLDDRRKTSISPVDINPSKMDTPESTQNPPPPVKPEKEYEDVLELYAGELKSELDKEMLAPVPALSKWEMEDEPNQAIASGDLDSKLDKSKVTQDVLKRAENAIFAKAINAIRPIEIKKISLDRIKLYSGEKDDKKDEEVKKGDDEESAEGTAEQFGEPVEEQPMKPPVRLSVKERLGCKVDELDRIVRIDKPYDRNRSKTLSPLAKRSQDIRNDRRVVEVNKRKDRAADDRDRGRDRRDRNYRGEKDSRRDGRDTRESRVSRDDSRGGGGGGGDLRDRDRDRERDRRRGGAVDDRSREFNSKDRFRNRLGEKDEDKGRPPRVFSQIKRDDRSSDKRKRTRTRSRSRSEDKKDKDKQKKKDKKQRKEKEKDVKEKERDKDKDKKKHKKEADDPPKVAQIQAVPPSSLNNNAIDTAQKEVASTEKPLAPLAPPPVPAKTAAKRKVTLDEENFVPDYDAESEHDEEKKKAESSSVEPAKKRKTDKDSSSNNSSSDSSSDDDNTKKKKKHKKHNKKKKQRRDSSSSSSNSDTSSSDDEKEQRSKKKKHKKKSKKKKKGKHKA